MKHNSLLAILALFAGLAFAQQSQPSQPPDPTAQSPATQAPATPPTLPDTKSKPDSQQPPEAQQSKDWSPASQQAAKVFTGTITRDKGVYVLRAGDQKYKLDDQSKVQEFKGKQVKVQGSLDRDSNMIHVEKIEASPSM